MQIKALWKSKLQYDDIHDTHKLQHLTWKFERNFVQRKESKFILSFYHNTEGSLLSLNSLTCLASEILELQELPGRWLAADLSTPALWVTPDAILVQLKFTSEPSPS